MCDQNTRPMRQRAAKNAIRQKMMSDMRVNSGKRIVKQNDIALVIGRSSNADPLPLSARKGDALFANLRSVGCTSVVDSQTILE